jgi:hypothetical protein
VATLMKGMDEFRRREVVMRARRRARVCAVSLGLLLAPAAARAQTVCQPRTDGPGRECYVAKSGNDANPGTLARPFRTIARGVSVLQAGDALSIRHGVYVEAVALVGKHGTASQPIVIRGYEGETAYLDGSVAEFRDLHNADWEPAALHDPAAHPDEYVSVASFGDSVRGAFLDRNPYTRLIKYSRLEDLRAANETFEAITDPGDPRPGPGVVKCAADGTCVPALACDSAGENCQPFRFPWVYMGPGIWIDPEATPANPQRVHIRLSHTHNDVPGLPDYAGAVDPREVRLALSPKSLTTLLVQGSSHLRFERLTVRYGGENTVRLPNVTDVVFDHVRFWTSSYGVGLASARRTTFQHCEFDGGRPTWYFRSDRKSEYTFLENGQPALNNLGKQTLRSLTVSGAAAADNTIHHCEFHHAHDLYLGGTNIDFHHNWIHNLDDEGLFLDANQSAEVRIHENVITKTLSPISFAGEQVAGPFSIYRNLVDVRAPTAGHRPRRPGDRDVWRYGNTFKSNGVDGPYALFQNTFLVYGQGGQASYLHYRSTGGESLRRSFNNIFVAVNPDDGSDRPITFLPPPSFPGPTDGNLYHRLGPATRPLFRYLGYTFQGGSFRAGTFDSLAELRTGGKPFFAQSKTQYPPGYEANSLEADPQFLSIGSDGRPRLTDDLRLGAASPARAAGVVLPADLLALDSPITPSAAAPDIGAQPFGSPALAVGVDGRRTLGPPAPADAAGADAAGLAEGVSAPGVAPAASPNPSFSLLRWSKAAPLSSAMGVRRNLHPARGAIHMHTVYSNDACYGDPRPSGGLNILCRNQLADALCQAHTDFVAFTDHNDTMADTPFASLLAAARGDGQLLPASGPPRAMRATLACSAGGTSHTQVLLSSVGAEAGDLMPIMLDHHVTTDAFFPNPYSTLRVDIEARRRIYQADQIPGQLASYTADRERAAGALVFTVHTESEPLWRLRATNPIGVEIYNLHADLDPAIRSTYLRDAAGAPLVPNGALEAIASYGFLNTPVTIGDLLNAPEPDLAFISFMKPNLPALDKWDILLGEGRKVMGIGGTDSHQLGMPVALRDGEHIDSHRRFVRLFSTVVLTTTVPNTGAFDPAVLKNDLAAGRTFLAFELLGTPVGFDVRATATTDPMSPVRAELGGEVGPGAVLQVTLPSVAYDPASQTAPEITAKVFRIDAPRACGGAGFAHCYCNAAPPGDACPLLLNMVRPTRVQVGPTAAGAGTTFSVPLILSPGAARTAYRVEVYIKPRHLASYLGLSATTRALADPAAPYAWIYSSPIYVTDQLHRPRSQPRRLGSAPRETPADADASSVSGGAR